MLLSMTGYGRATHTFKDKAITIEIRSLNSKFTDIRFKIPQNYKEKDADLRKIITKKAERGKIELAIEILSMQGDDDYSLNSPLFKKYYAELKKMSEELGMDKGDLMQAILRLPNIVVTSGDKVDEEEWQAVLHTLYLALDNFHKFRLAEGSAMEEDLRLRTRNILSMLEQIDPHEKERITRLRQRLHQNLEEFLGKENVDENRFEQEILFYLEKMDITEEKVRLGQHCHFFLEQLNKSTSQKGRKLNFISQEMGREINTLGAKANSSDIQRLVVAMKDDLEKIKEQIANSV